MDYTVHVVTMSWTQLSDFITLVFLFITAFNLLIFVYNF